MAKRYFQKSDWLAFEYQNVTYDLSHLDEHLFSVPAIEKDAERRIAVTFGDHCFTRAPIPGDDKALEYPDCSRDPGSFCLPRYCCSLNLVRVIEDAATGKVWLVEGDNYAFFCELNDSNDPTATMNYVVIFGLDPVKGLPVHLRMHVHSAFPCSVGDITAYGFTPYRHLVTLRIKNRRPPRIIGGRRKMP